ncbi:hypothetical protein HOU04_gp087 [Synechococcus phage S-T4]|uniref:Uncharacterized protein n=1 Tax=Synechococcus phage S-T4 TaxID=2268578 RepID=A0A385EFJ8_9CAUD|nr:hypothetical protein HOU04_gp087 [Synechococcus phage S-T4]AXQ70486.1 hypothetical protein [Synechococcus phage S-T4]
MYNEQTPEKLREIIRDTWPQLYWLKKKKEKINGIKHTNTNTNKGVV